MSKVLIKNNREHVIHLNMTVKGIVQTHTVPMAKQNPDDRSKIVLGELAIDEETLAKLRENPLVDAYFKQGWLHASTPSPVGPPTPKPKPVAV